MRLAGAVEILDVCFCDSFCGSHDAGGVDGLVCADHDEVVDAGVIGGFGDGHGADDIILSSTLLDSKIDELIEKRAEEILKEKIEAISRGEG